MTAVKVLVFKSADPDYFISHVDVTRITEYREEAAKLTGEASIGLLFRHLSASRLVTIAQIEGRVRGAGSEFVLACDMRFAARESAIFGQPEAAFGVIPGAGGIQHLARLMGRARALEVMLSAEDYDAELAERYGWINRALPANALGDFVRSLAHRIARLSRRWPRRGQGPGQCDRARAGRGLPPRLRSVRRGRAKPEAQSRIQAALKRGFQTRDAEMDLARLLWVTCLPTDPQHEPAELNMTITQARSETAIQTPTAREVDMKLEAVVIPVADVDGAKRFLADWAGGSMPISPSVTHSGSYSSRLPVPGGRDLVSHSRADQRLSNHAINIGHTQSFNSPYQHDNMLPRSSSPDTRLQHLNQNSLSITCHINLYNNFTTTTT